MHFLAAITSPTRLSQRLFHSTFRNGSQAPSSSHFQHSPSSSSTLGDHNSEQHLPRPSNTFTSMTIFLLVTLLCENEVILTNSPSGPFYCMCYIFQKKFAFSSQFHGALCFVSLNFVPFLHSNPQGHSVLHIQLLCIYESSELGIISQVLSAHTKFLHQNH